MNQIMKERKEMMEEERKEVTGQRKAREPIYVYWCARAMFGYA